METIKATLGAFTAVAPFLAQYPSWVKALFAIWLATTAVLVAALALAPRAAPAVPDLAAQTGPSVAPKAELASADVTSRPWLVISAVELFGPFEGARIRVDADVNGTQYSYPSLVGAKWAEVGPAMSPQQFALPASTTECRVRFKAVVRQGAKETQLISQRTVVVHVPEDLPHKDTYSLYRLGDEGSRAANVSAEVTFSVTASVK